VRRNACAAALVVLACQGNVIDDTRRTSATDGDAGACKPLPCPSSAPWNASTCQCETDAAAPATPIGDADAEAPGSPISCPLSAPLDPVTGECSVADWPDPPPYCVAPCVWAAVKKCLPVRRACVSQTVDSPTGDVFVHCQPDTEWESRSGWLGGFGTRVPRTVRTITTSEGLCYSASVGFDYFERNFGVALEAQGTVTCASVEELLRRSAERLPDEGISLDGLDQYVLDRSRPECDAWDEFGIPKAPCDATPGECSEPTPP